MHPQQKLFEILDRHPSYPLAAYHAIHKGLSFASKNKRGSSRHVTGQELSLGMAGYLLAEFGPFAALVAEGWGIRSTSDFGRLVYNLIEAGLMQKQETDRIEDFDNVYEVEQMLSGEPDWLEAIRLDLGLPAANTTPRW